MSTITARIAQWACDVTYDDLTSDAIDAAKRFLFDTLGCALGGYQVHDCKLFLEHYRTLQQPGSCTVVGAGDRMNVVSASMLNALMTRAMDYNDIYWKQDPSHPSDLASAPLAIAEMRKLSGRDLLVGLVLGWDLTMRLCHIAVPGIRERGWHHATLMAYATPVVAGKMLGLNPEQLQHAIGIASCHSFTLGCAVAGKLTMMKNTVSPMSTRNGVEAALLAQRGYTGPEGVIEGKEGMEHCLGEGWDYSWITDKLASTKKGAAAPDPANGIGWMITQCGMKSFPIEALMHSPVSATLQIVKENDLKPEDIAEIRIESIARAADILSDPAKYDPQSKESADHSLPYCIAAAVTDRMVTPRQFKDERLWDERLRSQMKKVKVVANDEFEKAFPAKQCTRVTITTTSGGSFTAERDYPKGDPRDPMTIEEIGEKFDALAEPVMTVQRRKQLKERIFDLENCKDVGELMALTVGDR
ncbi:MAG: MmgE/PrpD family protein [Planctomycetota bacterium]|nr:MAG: MmgE/PrpD family protein [Planctomycetota bacterium]